MTTAEPFTRVPEPLRAALLKKGFEGLTAVQQAVVDSIEQQRESGGPTPNLRISSQTGSGKTVAVGLALAPTLLSESPSPNGGPSALVITPTRELAAQFKAELEWLYGNCKDVRLDVVTGGTDVRREQQRLKRCARILVGTPGRLLDHLGSGALNCSELQTVILDEADQMLDMGFRDELTAIVEQLPQDRRSHLVSATFSSQVQQLARDFQGDALQLEGTRLGAANQDIQHLSYLVHPRERYPALVNLLLQHWGQRCLVFVQKRSDTTELAEMLAGDGFSALPFSGDLAQAQRTRTLNAFKSGIINTLIATDVAARGIDVPDISVVIHGDLPREPEVYTHRSGRTGRAGKTGQSLILVPTNAQARLRRLLQTVRIEAPFTPVPTAKKIQQKMTKGARRDLYARLQDAEFSEAELSYAQMLLERDEPQKAVAMLLRMAEPALPREPMAISQPEPYERPARHSGQRDASPVPPRNRRANGRFVRFFINWGQRHGANPNRVLSHVCRRGELGREQIGQIRVGPHSTIVEVSEDVAVAFERQVRKPDERDPQVRVTRDHGGAGNGGGPQGRPFPNAERPQHAGEKSRPVGPRVPRAARRRRTLSIPTES